MSQDDPREQFNINADPTDGSDIRGSATDAGIVNGVKYTGNSHGLLTQEFGIRAANIELGALIYADNGDELRWTGTLEEILDRVRTHYLDTENPPTEIIIDIYDINRPNRPWMFEMYGSLHYGSLENFVLEGPSDDNIANVPYYDVDVFHKSPDENGHNYVTNLNLIKVMRLS